MSPASRTFGAEPLEHRQVAGSLGQRPGAGEIVTDLRLGRDDDVELLRTGVHPDVVESDDVRRVGAGDPQARRRTRDDEDARALGDRAWEQVDDLGVDGFVPEVDHLEVQQLGHRARDVTLVEDAAFDKQAAQPDAAAFGARFHLLGECVLELLGREHADFDHDVTEAATGGRGAA